MRGKERIPLHDHRDRNAGGPIDSSRVGRALGVTMGGSFGSSGSSGTTSATGPYELKIEGGQSTIKAHGSMGSTETFDPTDGNVHTGILDANCTFTLNAPAGSGAATLELWITGSGTRAWTWPGSVTWDGGVTGDPPADTATVRVILETIDGGTNWIANMVGGGSSVAALDDLTDVTITAPAADDTLRYISGEWVNDDRKWEAVTGGEDIFVWSGDDLVYDWSA